jgi:general secretion pathway protein D
MGGDCKENRLMLTVMKNMLVVACVAAALTGCTAGRTMFSKAEKLEQEGRLDEAVLRYAEAIAENPGLSEYRLRFLKAAEKASKIHLEKGERLLAEGKLDDALREFQAAVALDASLEKARQLAAQAQKLRDAQMFFAEGEEFEKGRKLREAYRAYQQAVALNPGHREAKAALERLVKSKKTKLDGYELNLKSQKPITLKFKEAKLKDVFTIVTQLSGINFVFDEGIKDQNVTIHLENASFPQALDILTGMHKLGRKVLNESTIILYAKTPEKAKQYEDLVVKTFYLNRLDAKKAVNLVRTMLQVKKIYVNEENNALVIRDTPETIEVASKILEANDVPDAEVLLEVEIIELAKKNTESFGLALSRYSIAGVLDHNGTLLSDVLSAATDSGTSPTDRNNLLPFNFGSPHGYVTVPNATFNFGKTLANGETLSNPKLRVKNHEKAKFTVGTRVPITTTSTTGTTGGYSVNVQYVDVGVKLNAEPTIQLSNEISLKLGLEVSSIINRESVGSDKATTVVTIGTRNLDTVLNLKDGETTIIGGLIQDIKNKNKNKVTLLGDIPVIGTLLSSHDDSNDKTELILAITPRIIKSIVVPDDEVINFWSGKDDEPSAEKPYASFIQEPEFIVPASSMPQPAPVAVPTTPPVPAPAAPLPEKAKPAPPVQSVEPPSAESRPVTEAALIQAPAQIEMEVPADVKVGEAFKIIVSVTEAKNLHAAPMVMTIDPAVTDFIAAELGAFFKQDGKPVQFTPSFDNKTGLLNIILARPTDGGGVNGAGTLAVLTFKAKKKGLIDIDVKSITLSEPGGKPVDVSLGIITVDVK